MIEALGNIILNNQPERVFFMSQTVMCCRCNGDIPNGHANRITLERYDSSDEEEKFLFCSSCIDDL